MAAFTIRMSGLEGRLQWRRHQAIQASCQAFFIAKNLVLSINYMPAATEHRAISGAAIRILNLRFAQFLCAAQELGESQISKAGAGSRGMIIFSSPIR